VSESAGGSQNLRALHVIANLDIGGAQEVVRSLAPALRAEGVDVAVATLRDGPLREPLEEAGIPVTVVGARSRSLARDPGAVIELRQLHGALAAVVDQHASTIIQTHLLRSLDFVVLALRRRRSRPEVAWTFHNAQLDLRADQLPGRRWLLRPKQLGYRMLYRQGSRRAHLVAVSDDVATAIRTRIRPSRGHLHTIPNGVAVERYAHATPAGLRTELQIPVDGCLVVCVAKMLEQKGHRHLVDAMLAPPLREAPLHVALVGDGPLREAIRARARDAGVLGRLHLLGNRSDVPSVLAAADAFVLPSLWEGLPMALLEAMAAGLPVVATSVAGTRQVVEDERHGLLVPPGDPSALAVALNRVVRDPALRTRLGKAARNHVRAEFSVDAQARRHADLYRVMTGASTEAPRPEGT
jgi:glycosyltransferase involved in cell wall biosynthesis